MLVVSAIDSYTTGKGLLDLVNELNKFILSKFGSLIVTLRQKEERRLLSGWFMWLMEYRF